MSLPIEHLSTFAAIIDEGSFEAAARRLHITPSAVSQRVRAMEDRVGTVLLRRTRPVTATDAGLTVLRAARQVERIVGDASAELITAEFGAAELGGHDAARGTGPLIRLVVNADSLATWFVPALARAARDTGARFEVLRADETVSTERLRSGDVMAALTATAEAVPGCTSTRIAVDRYRAVAAPEFASRHFADGLSAAAFRSAPMVEFDRHDAYQQRFMRRTTRARIDPPRHFIPSSAEFVIAIELGMGWGMVPERQCAEPLAAGRLVELAAGSAIELPLYWQRWNLRSPVFDRVSDIIAEEATAALG